MPKKITRRHHMKHRERIKEPARTPSLDSRKVNTIQREAANKARGEQLIAEALGGMDPQGYELAAEKMLEAATKRELEELQALAKVAREKGIAPQEDNIPPDPLLVEPDGTVDTSGAVEAPETLEFPDPEGDDDPEADGAPAPLPVKRGRGRPRKAPRPGRDKPRVVFEEVANALLRASTDLRYFIERFLWIEDKATGELIRFPLNPEQLIVVEEVQKQLNANKPVRMIILKPRQIGVSTLWEAIAFWAMVFTPNYSIRVILDKREKAEVLLRTTKRFRDLFPEEACLRKGYDSKKSISVDNSTVLSVVNAMRLHNLDEAISLLQVAYDDPERAKESSEASKSLHSIIVLESADKMAGRSATVRFLHTSEVAFWPGDPGDAFNGLKNSVPFAARTFIVVESTAFGRGGYFYNAWKRAERNESGYQPVFFPWFSHPEYTATPNYDRMNVLGHETLLDDIDEDEKRICRQHGVRGDGLIGVMHWLGETWTIHPEGSGRGVALGNLWWRRRTIADNCEGQLEKFNAEYPGTPEEAFVAAGADFFPRAVQDRVQAQCNDFPIIAQGDFVYENDELRRYTDRRKGEALPKATFRTSEGEEAARTAPLITIWEQPVAGRLYVIGGDVAQGLSPTKNVREPDWSVLYVLDAISGMVCARLRGRIQPEVLAEKTALLGRMYNDALVGIEANPQGGGIVANKLLTSDYDYWNVMYHKDIATTSGEYQDRIGWYTHAGNRTAMLNHLLVALSQNTICVPDKQFFNEMIAFVRDPNTGKPKAAAGEFDDCVMALGIANMVRMEPLGLTADALAQIRDDERQSRENAVAGDDGSWVFRKQREMDEQRIAAQKNGEGFVHPRLGRVY